MFIQSKQREDLIPSVKGVYLLPVVHGSLEFTLFIRTLFLTDPPSALALELPISLSGGLKEALPFFDQIPLISIPDRNSKESILILEPLEPIVEAARSAYELSIPIHCIDKDHTNFFTTSYEDFPDTFSLHTISLLSLYDLYSKQKSNLSMNRSSMPHHSDELYADRYDVKREAFMSKQIRTLTPFIHSFSSKEREPYMLAVVGMRHVSGILRYLQMDDDAFASTLKTIEEDQSDSVNEFHQDDFESEEPLEALLNHRQLIDHIDRNKNYQIYVLSSHTPEVLTQPAYYNNSWLSVRKNERVLKHFNRIMLQRAAYRESVERYERESGEIFPPQREKLFFRFTRNWSYLEQKLLPDLYKLVMAARAFGNDNFARIMYDLLTYLSDKNPSPFSKRRLTLDDLHRDSRLIRFRLRLKRKQRILPPKIIKRFQKEKYPGEWLEQTDVSAGICSYPPEDIVIEEFGHYLQKHTRSLIQGKENKTIPFSSSLMDGIDYRESIRNYYTGKIFVKDEMHRGVADVGSVVVIFDEDDVEHNWKMVWWGEHTQESDMALYATPPADRPVGPGIFRSVYGGLLLTSPPGRIHDIWNDPAYNTFSNPADRLLAGAIEYNDKKIVVHVSDRAPSAKLQSIAGRFGQRIVHIPLATIDPVTSGRVRRFHVLDSKERRNDAGDYIW